MLLLLFPELASAFSATELGLRSGCWAGAAPAAASQEKGMGFFAHAFSELAGFLLEVFF